MNGTPADQPSAAPTRKVGTGLVAGSAVTILVWFLDLVGISVPAEVAAALTTILVFVASYFVQEGPLLTPPPAPPESEGG
jgi:hypothetical protein